MTFVEVYHKSVEDVMMLKASGCRVIEAGIRRSTDGDLSTLVEVMTYKGGRRGSTEDRLPQMVEVLFPKMRELEYATSRLQREQEDLSKKLLQLFIAAQCDVSKFLKDVENEQVRRRVLRERNQPIQSEDQDGRSCSIA